MVLMGVTSPILFNINELDQIYHQNTSAKMMLPGNNAVYIYNTKEVHKNVTNKIDNHTFYQWYIESENS